MSDPRTLVLCFDGTSNQYDSDNTNVVKFVSLLKKGNLEEQLCYYQAGIGIYFNPGVVSPMLQWFAKIADEAVAWYLDEHVMEGYMFLMQNYRTGDKICLFGFSRGAYTARALACMLLKIGLLPKYNRPQVPFAYQPYKRTDEESIQLSASFKKTFCQSITIEFIGVWDTVEHVGFITGRTLPIIPPDQDVRTIRHALSLDEFCTVPYKLQARLQEESKESSRYETNMLEVWFSGSHTDVGGGTMPNSSTSSLSDITLRWMVREVIYSQCGIQFDADSLERLSMSMDFFPPGSPSSVGEEEPDPELDPQDAKDAMLPIHSQWKAGVGILWWLFELIPMSYPWQNAKGVWHKGWRVNLGRGRVIPYPDPKFHVTVKARMANAALNYKPKAIWKAGTETYVQ